MNQNHPKILVVEDEPDICTSVQSYFGRRGFVVSTTGSGLEALSMIKAGKPDLVILDITLRDLNGIDVLSTLRKYDKDTKVVIITGQMYSEEQINDIMALGVSGYRSKPLVLEEIEKLVYEVLGNKKFIIRISKKQQPTDESTREVVHQLSNLLGIIRNKCENFMLDLNDGIYKNKSEKEIIDMAIDAMDTVIKTVDRAAKTVERIPEFSKKGKK